MSGEMRDANEKRKAVFLDRDGTIIKETDVVRPEDIHILPHSAEGIAYLNKLGYAIVVVTNQPIIEKKIITLQESDKLNNFLKEELNKQSARIDAVYTCPHRYPSSCRCRKPNIGMIEDAVNDLNLDLSRSFIVGDSARDIQAGFNAHIPGILVKTGVWDHDPARKFFDVTPQYAAADLLEAAKLIEKLSGELR